MTNTPEHNWAGNVVYGATTIHRPTTVAQLQEIVAGSSKLRVLGSRHSFNTIADCAGDLISLEHFDNTISIDQERHTVTVNGGITYGQLALQLHRAGYALHNMASLPHISVAGAIATATHGSGDGNGNLATAVTALEIVKANGDVVVLSREQHGEEFPGAIVGLGGLGVVTKVTLKLEPAFAMQQEVYENLPVVQLEAHFDQITSSAYSVSLFTDWHGETVNEVWLKRRLPSESGIGVTPTFFDATHAQKDVHPVLRLSAEPCTPQMGVSGPWNDRLPHFKIDHVPASGDEVQTEYFVPRQHAIAAMRALAGLRDHMTKLLWTSEVRTIAADTLWMSPCYGQAGVGLHFSWHRDLPAVEKLLPIIEAALAPFEARPHWGKLFTMSPSRVQSLYKKMPDFRELLRAYDPQGKFRNAFLDAYVFGVD